MTPHEAKQTVQRVKSSYCCTREVANHERSVRADLHRAIFVACDKITTGLQFFSNCRVRQKSLSILKQVVNAATIVSHVIGL